MKTPVNRIAHALVALDLALLAAAAPGCDGPQAPADPAWADVQLIVQGQCSHCHGPTAELEGGGFRFDFLDAPATCTQEAADDLGAGFLPAPSFITHRELILEDIKPARAGQRPKMPPEPARLLEDWQVETLERFIAKLNNLPPTDRALTARGPTPADARAPRISVQPSRSMNVLTVDYVVSDENADPVIGELRVGDELKHKIDSAGAGQAVFDLRLVPAATPLQLSARLCDGWGIRLRDAADGLPTVSR